MIMLGLSGRIIEQSATNYQMSTPDFIAATAEIGYQAVELRAGQLNVGTPDAEIADIGHALSQNGVACAFCNCLVAQDADTLGDVRRMAEIARGLASPYLRMGMTDVGWMQRACDIADEYEVGVVVQIHTNTPLETVEGAMRVCAQIERPNFGLTYEPANFVLAGRDYGAEALKQLGDRLRNVTLQNLKPVEQTEGEGVIVHNGRGFTRCLPGDPDGVSFDKVFAGLKAVGYRGYATLIEPISPTMDSMALAKLYLEKLAPLC